MGQQDDLTGVAAFAGVCKKFRRSGGEIPNYTAGKRFGKQLEGIMKQVQKYYKKHPNISKEELFSYIDDVVR